MYESIKDKLDLDVRDSGHDRIRYSTAISVNDYISDLVWCSIWYSVWYTVNNVIHGELSDYGRLGEEHV